MIKKLSSQYCTSAGTVAQLKNAAFEKNPFKDYCFMHNEAYKKTDTTAARWTNCKIESRLLQTSARNPTIVTVPRTMAGAGAPSPTPQKYVIVASNARPTTPVPASQVAPVVSTSSTTVPTLLKIVTTSSPQTMTAKMVTSSAPMTKLVVVQNPANIMNSAGENTVTLVTTQPPVNRLTSEMGSRPSTPDIDTTVYVSTTGVE